jgi:hypothetical protein
MFVATYGINRQFCLRTRCSRQRCLQNYSERLGDDGNKHGYLPRVLCERCLAIFNFHVSFENSAFAANDAAARDLVSSYFCFPWELTLKGFCAFARPFVPREQLPIVPRLLRPCTLLGGEGTVSGTRGNIW